MRDKMAAQYPGRNGWDLKYAPGGLMDIEFIAQALQLIHAPAHPAILDTNTIAALDKMAAAGFLEGADARLLIEAPAGTGADPDPAHRPGRDPGGRGGVAGSEGAAGAGRRKRAASRKPRAAGRDAKRHARDFQSPDGNASPFDKLRVRIFLWASYWSLDAGASDCRSMGLLGGQPNQKFGWKGQMHLLNPNPCNWSLCNRCYCFPKHSFIDKIRP